MLKNGNIIISVMQNILQPSILKNKHIINSISYLFWINQENFPYVYFIFLRERNY